MLHQLLVTSQAKFFDPQSLAFLNFKTVYCIFILLEANYLGSLLYNVLAFLFLSLGFIKPKLMLTSQLLIACERNCHFLFCLVYFSVESGVCYNRNLSFFFFFFIPKFNLSTISPFLKPRMGKLSQFCNKAYQFFVFFLLSTTCQQTS